MRRAATEAVTSASLASTSSSLSKLPGSTLNASSRTGSVPRRSTTPSVTAACAVASPPPLTS
jgi:hypothetical protein